MTSSPQVRFATLPTVLAAPPKGRTPPLTREASSQASLSARVRRGPEGRSSLLDVLSF